MESEREKNEAWPAKFFACLICPKRLKRPKRLVCPKSSSPQFARDHRRFRSSMGMTSLIQAARRHISMAVGSSAPSGLSM